MTVAKTSESHPIRVDWLPVPWLGSVGLTFAPGKKQLNAATGSWDRHLPTDLARLRGEFGADHLVCLLENHELDELGIPELAFTAEAAGIAFHRLPLRDGSFPNQPEAFAAMVANITGWAAAGENVVVHCKGGLGRAGMFGGCVLRTAGLKPELALAELKAARGPSCPETSEQRQFIHDFVPGPPSAESRVLGAIIAAAAGDALGHPTEFLSTAQIRATYGLAGVTGFECWWNRDGQQFAPYTDDTQMAEIVLRSLVKHGGPVAAFEPLMLDIAAGFAEWLDHPQGGHRAPGNACMAGARRLAEGMSWRQAGGARAGGCGSVMRAYPFGLLLARDVQRAEEWAVAHSRMTHQDPIALAACAAMANGMAGEMVGREPDLVLSSMIEAAARYDSGTATMCAQAVDDARSGIKPDDVLQKLQGWAAHEAIAAAMFVVARYGPDLRGALLAGANAPGDSDSIATLAGALLGARLGLEAVPQEWVRDIERSKELLALGRAATETLGLP